MPIEIPRRAAFLKRSHLFNGLTDDQINAVAAELTEETFPANKDIVKKDDPGDRIYFIWKGKVKVTQVKRKKEIYLANLVAGDYFGEEAMIASHHKRTATVTATEEVQALVLTRDQFRKLLKQAPQLKSNFSITVSSHRLARSTRFKWLLPNEVIYFLARKNKIRLVNGVAAPAILFFIGVISMFASWLFYMPGIVWWIALVVTVIASLWGIWQGVDWGNDYYIVTNTRVVWLEKIVGVYDSRQESPLSAIQRVNVETDYLGRRFDYGNLIVRTIVGNTVALRYVDHPFQAAALIEEHWRRSQESSRQMEENEMRDALKARLVLGPNRPLPTAGLTAKPAPKRDPYKGLRSRQSIFKVRFEDKSIITYRKHWVVLFQQVWKQTILILVMIVILIASLFENTFLAKIVGMVELEVFLILWALLLVGFILWWIYQYVDWSNDIFQVTADQIMDIDKTPFGSETSDVAALDNVLSTEYERRGLTQLIMNYGTVYITIGGGKQMAFEDVFDPSGVQQDIERRRLERIAKKEADKVKAERERMADWFAAYYNSEQAFRTEQSASAAEKDKDKKEGTQ
jgi:CRP-like cAMP-binding protein